MNDLFIDSGLLLVAFLDREQVPISGTITNTVNFSRNSRYSLLVISVPSSSKTVIGTSGPKLKSCLAKNSEKCFSFKTYFC